jgi:cytochrome c oxidase subunit 2
MATLTDGTQRLVDAAYVRASILSPQAFARPGFPPTMPSFEGVLREHEIESITAFIASLAAKP